MRRDRSTAIIVKENKVLMVQVKFDGRLFWQAPGGGVEAGELDGVVGAWRERQGVFMAAWLDVGGRHLG